MPGVRKKRRIIPGVDPARWETDTQPPLPDWLARVRDDQADVVERVVKEFATVDVVFLDAPTGSGKSLVGELVRREMDVARGLYVCTTKSLQAQYVGDFAYARELKGRRNYLPTKFDRWRTARPGDLITCADCDRGPVDMPLEDQSCSYCEFVDECPYLVARSAAEVAPVGVLNTSYLLAEANGPGRFGGKNARELVVADESDLLEEQLLGYVELRVPNKLVGEVGLEVPKKGSHMTTIRRWVEEELLPAMTDRVKGLGRDLEGRRERDRLERLRGNLNRVVAREDGWVRDGDEEGEGRKGAGDGLVLKPVYVHDLAEDALWRHGKKWLCMTGTLVSAEMEAEALGLEDNWGVVEAPMLFPKEHRRVVFAPLASMTRKGQEAGGLKKILRGIDVIVERHPGVNVLIHTHTYLLAKEISQHLRGSRKVTGNRPIITYTGSWGRDDALDSFKAGTRGHGAIMVASSMDRGVDLPGDLCRVQIIVKVPMASLGSRQVSERMRAPGGELWYLVNTVRTIMQMCGRAVRGMDDEAVTYIVDLHFGAVLKQGRRLGLWPQWWLDGLEAGRVRDFGG